MALYIPANLSRQELTDMLRSVPVTVGGAQSNLLDAGERIRTGSLVLSAAAPGAAPVPATAVNLADLVPNTGAVHAGRGTDVDVTDDSVTVQRHGGRVSVTIDL